MPGSMKKTVFILSGLMVSGLALGGLTFSVDRLFETSDIETTKTAAQIEAATEVARSSFAQIEDTAWTVAALDIRFERVNYDLALIRDGAEVPRLFMDKLPGDLAKVQDVKEKKEYFIRTVLPLILAENDRVLADRNLLISIRDRKLSGLTLEEEDLANVDRLAKTYRVKDGNIHTLLQRVDAVPVSLALAQAVEESGWGTSRFAREGNALYGQWTTDATQGILPANRDSGKNHLIRKFESLSGSVAGYMRNINTHRAYRDLRAARAEMRVNGKPLNGYELASHLESYSERGQDYVDGLRALMRVNKLVHFDEARLKSAEVALFIEQ